MRLLVVGVALAVHGAGGNIQEVTRTTLERLGPARPELHAQLVRARGHYLRGLDMAIEAGNRPVATGLLFLVAALESDAGRHERALHLWAAAESLRAASGAVRPAVAHRLLGDPVTTAREAIGDAAADAAIEHGKGLDYETALTYAHGDDDSAG